MPFRLATPWAHPDNCFLGQFFSEFHIFYLHQWGQCCYIDGSSRVRFEGRRAAMRGLSATWKGGWSGMDVGQAHLLWRWTVIGSAFLMTAALQAYPENCLLGQVCCLNLENCFVPQVAFLITRIVSPGQVCCLNFEKWFVPRVAFLIARIASCRGLHS